MMFRPYGFLAPKDFKIIRLSNILALRLFQKRVVRIKFDIYVFIILLVYSQICTFCQLY